MLKTKKDVGVDTLAHRENNIGLKLAPWLAVVGPGEFAGGMGLDVQAYGGIKQLGEEGGIGSPAS